MALLPGFNDLVRETLLALDAEDNFALQSDDLSSLAEFSATKGIYDYYATALIRLVQEHGDEFLAEIKTRGKDEV
jgi:hypothetical protein